MKETTKLKKEIKKQQEQIEQLSKINKQLYIELCQITGYYAISDEDNRVCGLITSYQITKTGIYIKVTWLVDLGAGVAGNAQQYDLPTFYTILRRLNCYTEFNFSSFGYELSPQKKVAV